jgi:hypothetical protein
MENLMARSIEQVDTVSIGIGRVPKQVSSNLQ